jgi:hypothetical protein
MLYEALAGQRPEGAFPPLHRLRPEVPSRLDQLLLHLLQPDPGARVTSALEAKRGLARGFARASRRPLAWAVTGVAASALAVVLLLVGRDRPATKDAGLPPTRVTKQAATPEVPSVSVAPGKPAAELPVQRATPEKAAPTAADALADFSTKASTKDSMKSSTKSSMKDSAKDSAKGKLGRMTSSQRSNRKGKNVDLGKLKTLMDNEVDKNEPFLDSNSARPTLLQQSSTQATQPIPLLKPPPQAQAEAGKMSVTPKPAAKSGPPRKERSKGSGEKDVRDVFDFGPTKK